MAANLRELIAAALLSSDLSQSPLIEAAIDRVGALAFTDPLGAELWRLLAHQADAHERVVVLLSRRAARIIGTMTIRRKVCQACVREYLDANCQTCGGTGWMGPTTFASKRLCPTCQGARQRRYSDLWRARQLGMPLETYRRWDRRYAAVFGLIGDADRITFQQLAQQLERVIPRKRLEFSTVRATLLVVGNTRSKKVAHP